MKVRSSKLMSSFMQCMQSLGTIVNNYKQVSGIHFGVGRGNQSSRLQQYWLFECIIIYGNYVCLMIKKHLIYDGSVLNQLGDLSVGV